MNGIWDIKADSKTNGDNLRDVSPIVEKTWKDENEFSHYVFSKVSFNNPWYSIPDNDYDLFEDFIRGGSRSYPSDGSIPCDIVAREARKVLKEIESCSNDPDHHYCEEARKALKNGKLNVIRGTLKLYLGKYTTRDWRRKRFTDDIDFWMFQMSLLDSKLKECSFIKNKKTGEWEKKVEWEKLNTEEKRNEILFAANNLNQLLDFGAGAFLEGSDLKEIFDKKIKRGHDVDLSDIINVVMVNGGKEGIHEEEWLNAWSSFEEAINTRNSRTTSNLISLCRYSLAIADHLVEVSNVLKKYNISIFDKSKHPDEKLKTLCKISAHWVKFLEDNGPDETRKMLHNFYHGQAEEKPIHSKNLRDFAYKIMKLLNSKYEYLKIIFEIED
ncbi:MAG: hypothetical protein KGD73_00980 [Candidatus Lokiarchaeota archaeon]|nr:hypothetical protein [Candidatus Lokiarchaeota archaeon]